MVKVGFRTKKKLSLGVKGKLLLWGLTHPDLVKSILTGWEFGRLETPRWEIKGREVGGTPYVGFKFSMKF